MGDDIKAAKISAQLIATKIADGFMSPNFTGTVEQALDTEETLYSKQDSFNFSKFKDVAARMKLQAQLIKSINASRYQEYNTLARLVENVFRE